MMITEWMAVTDTVKIRDMISDAVFHGKIPFLVLSSLGYSYVFASRFTINENRIVFFGKTMKNPNEKAETIIVAEFKEWNSVWNLQECLRMFEYLTSRYDKTQEIQS